MFLIKWLEKSSPGPGKGAGRGGKSLIWLNLILFLKPMIGYCTFVSANEIIENLGQNHNWNEPAELILPLIDLLRK